MNFKLLTAASIKRVLAFQLVQEMKRSKLMQLATRMKINHDRDRIC